MKILSVLLTLVLAAGTVSAQETSPPPPDPAASNATRRPTPYLSPITVPSAASRIEQPAITVPLPPVVAVPQPPAFTSTCDSAGCWGSDGARYNGTGGMLIRPDGKVCRDVAGVMQCP